MAELRAILGIGFAFPLRIGGRLMRPGFGCGIHDYVFAPNNASTRGAIAHQVQRALMRFEPRIDVLGVRAETTPEQQNLILVAIDYPIRTNNAFHNLVYPFFLGEGDRR